MSIGADASAGTNGGLMANWTQYGTTGPSFRDGGTLQPIVSFRLRNFGMSTRDTEIQYAFGQPSSVKPWRSGANFSKL